MFVMLATGVGISYFALAWSATRLSFVGVHFLGYPLSSTPLNRH